ncbi:Protein CBG27517 [Caenorhabditis briggsae]|uniref:Protein CBG27517 n=1 Tax=Caenorhabditis briggsae TaxID=6238 RepID=B6IKH8_CAEBR|nr:Protein CBG27517 [Caenorhabditis briggsae]CAS00408.1 Protein CBG27517 [Caenorhabditis briggsae]
MVKDDDIPECQDYIEAAETNVPEDIFWRNLAFEKEHIAKAMDKRKGHRKFPMRDMFKGAVSQQDLVNEYYRSKNVERREMMMREEMPLERSSEILPEILETLKEAGIQMVRKLTTKKTRSEIDKIGSDRPWKLNSSRKFLEGVKMDGYQIVKKRESDDRKRAEVGTIQLSEENSGRRRSEFNRGRAL